MISSSEKTTLFNRIGRWFSKGYAAVKQSHNRQSAERSLIDVDNDQTKLDRDKAISRGRDHQKNFSIAGWMVRKHLDFIAEQSLVIKSGDKELDKDLEAAILELSTPANFDIRNIHSRESFTRIFEACAIIDGDCFAQKLQSGHIQPIEGDRVRQPEDDKEGLYTHGVRTNRDGAIAYISVADRGKYQNTFNDSSILRYSNVLHHGYFQRLDQYRGVSPLLAAMNDIQDVYENKAYALAKAKLGQFFGLALYRGTNEGEGETPDPTKGAMIIEMAQDDKAEMLSDKNPSTEWAAFMDQVISMSLKALDIPFSFYRENFTNFFGSKSALILYLKSCVSKRRNLRERFLDPWTKWKLGQLAIDDFPQIRNAIPDFRWIALGTPWANPLQEVQASIMEIGYGMTSRRRKVLEVYGEDVFDIIDEIKAEEDYMTEQGVQVRYPAALQPEIENDAS